jgi:DUF4097 and DUF4098 domain-containing protein YvlB
MYRIWRFIIIVCLLLVTACGNGEAATSAQELQLEANQLTKLVINNRNGEIEIKGADTDKIAVEAAITAKGISMDKLKLQLRAEGTTAYLDAAFAGQLLAMGSGTVNLRISVPQQMAVQLDSHRDGNLQVTGLSAPLKVDNVNGDIEIVDTKGPVTLSNRDGDMILRNIGADVDIDNINGHIQVTQVTGSARVSVGDGSLDIDGITGDAVIDQSGHGEIKLGTVGGKVTRK